MGQLVGRVLPNVRRLGAAVDAARVAVAAGRRCRRRRRRRRRPQARRRRRRRRRRPGRRGRRLARFRRASRSRRPFRARICSAIGFDEATSTCKFYDTTYFTDDEDPASGFADLVDYVYIKPAPPPPHAPGADACSVFQEPLRDRSIHPPGLAEELQAAGARILYPGSTTNPFECCEACRMMPGCHGFTLDRGVTTVLNQYELPECYLKTSQEILTWGKFVEMAPQGSPGAPK